MRQTGMPDWKRLLSHDSGPAVQFVKYVIAGGAATVTHVVCFYLTAWFLFPCLGPGDAFVRFLGLTVPDLTDAVRARHSLYANGLAFVFSNLVAYLLNRWFVFRPGRHPWVLEILMFYAVSGISLSIGSSLMGILIARYGTQTTIAFGANIVSSLLINYAMRRFVIFKG
jgi:putative flippase GtrA